MSKTIILASRSPRRQTLLRQLGLDFTVASSGVPEETDGILPPEDLVMRLAALKAEAVASNVPDGYIIGADTVVVLDGKILGKPADRDEAETMLKALSGKTHRVFTGFSILEKPSGRLISDYVKTEVTFRDLSEEEIRTYVRSGSPMDKAGAYGIQDDLGAVFVEKINGCFYNVVGFPLTRFYLRFRELNPSFGLD